MESIKISYYHNGSSSQPYAQIPISDLSMMLCEGYFMQKTEQLRQISDENYRRQFEIDNFPSVRFAGTFDKKGNLLEHSGLICLQLDQLADVKQMRIALLFDKYFEPQLVFTNPTGTGLNWVVKINVKFKFSHQNYFDAISNYLKSAYKVEPNISGGDVAKRCPIGYDERAFIAPDYIGKIMEGFPHSIYQVNRQKFQPGRWLGMSTNQIIK